MIEVKNVSQSYRRDEKNALSNINLTIYDRTITAVIGANGAGKSTLLGVMANNLKPSSGTVTIDGVDISKMKIKATAKKIAFLKQIHQVSIKITVNDLVEHGRFPHSGGRLSDVDREAVENALQYMNLTNLRNCFIGNLSGGQKQRAFIAMVLAQDTPYIFLDEPLNNLDIKYSTETMKMVALLANELKKTIVIVLHDINFAAAYADHIIAMKDGRIHFEDTPESTITPKVLNPIFDHDFNITQHGGKPVCLCYE